MTHETPLAGNVPGLPEHLSNMQNKAALAQCLLDAVIACMTDGSKSALAETLIDAAHDLAREINSGLDLVNLPKGAIR